MEGPDRVLLRSWQLLELIAAAYCVDTGQVSGPAWLSAESFDVEALVPAETPKGELPAMLQSLLEERFALRLHRVRVSRHGYALTAGKGEPRLTPEEPPRDPGREPDEQEQEIRQRLAAMEHQMRSTAESGANPAGFRMLSLPSVSLDELAQRLAQYTESPVIDETGLSGRFSVSITIPTEHGRVGEGIFRAIEDLGLKLEPRTLRVETPVVDQVSRTPAPN